MKRYLSIFGIILILLSTIIAACNTQQESVPAATAEPTQATDLPLTNTPAPTTAATGESTSLPTPSPTGDSKSTLPPRVQSRTPVETAIANLQPVIELHFNQPMNQDSVAEAFYIAPELPYELAWMDESNLQISILEPLEFEEQYEFVIEKTAESESGDSLPWNYQWAYELRNVISRKSGPTVNSPNSAFSIYFNYEMEADQPLDGLKLEPAIDGEWSWGADHQSVFFFPDGRYQPVTTYTVSFDSPFITVGGLQLPQLEPVEFNTPPSILWARPTSSNARPTEDIVIRFDRPMDEASTEAAFSTSPEIEGEFSWTETTLYFSPKGDYLPEETDIEVSVAATALDADGNAILNDTYTWSFRTGYIPNVASFGDGPNAQVLDVNGRRAIQYVLANRNSNRTLTFELYSLSLEQFLDRYASGFKGSAGHEFNPISTEGTEFAYSWEVESEVLPSEYGYVREVIIPGEVPPGLYLLNLNVGRLDDQLILLLTENTITVKQAEGQITAWVTDINGSPVSGIDVGVYSRDGQLLVQDATDSRGVFRGQIPDFEVGGPPSIEPLVVVAQKGNDITASGLTPEWRTYTGNYWYWWQPSKAVDEYAAYIYTDRPIYRPGQTVFFKAILRQDEDAILSVPPAGTPATVRIRDTRNNVVRTFQRTTNDFGSLDGFFELADGAMLGSYSVEVVLGDEVHGQIFKVEDYRKPDYQVSITTDAEKFMDGDSVTVVVNAEYFFGEPVPDAEVVLSQYKAERISYGPYSSRSVSSWSQPISSDTIHGRTNANGTFTATIKVDSDSYYSSSNWRSNLHITIVGLEATVDDGSHQSVSTFKPISVYNVSEYLTLNVDGYVQEPGVPFNISGGVFDIYDNPIEGRRLTVDIRRWSRESYGYDLVIQSSSMTTGADGRGQLTFTADESGFYQLRLWGRDRDGRSIYYNTYLYVFSRSYETWVGRSNDLYVQADKDSYAPGETARLIIESTFDGPALLTFERGTTRREILVELTAPATIVDVPIEATDVPNIHVIVNAWMELDTSLRPDIYDTIPDSRLTTAYVELSVPATTKILNVTITPDQEVYAPGDEATFTIGVTNYRGEPVSAEVSLAMVDEAIFALSEELSGPIYDAFYYERANIVRTFNALALIRRLNAGGYGGGGDGYSVGAPRSDFQDTAAWLPTLYTDASGQVQVTITLPDNLTSWRVTAKATTADTQIGETHTNILTQQPIVIRPILPRTLTAGDTVGVSAVVHNYSDSAQTLEVAVKETSESLLSFNDNLTQTITLAPDAIQIIGWSATVEEAGEATLIFSATPTSAGISSDFVQLPLTIRPLAIPSITSQIGQFNQQLATTIDMPAGALPLSQVEVQLSRTIAGSMVEGLNYLTGFPYGCVEQTMSKALPNAVVGRAMNQLGISDPALQADLPAKINASIQRLYGFQHNDGGWGWWFDDVTHDYQTAWVVFGLATTAEAGYEIDSDVINRGVDWMNDNLSTMDIRTRAFALYSMAIAGRPNLEATLSLYEKVDQLDTFSRAALALALHRLGENTEARAVLDLLAETAVTQNGYTYWPGKAYDGAYYSKTMASEVRSTALALSAFSTIQPGHELEGGMVRWLMSQRKHQGWGTTNETSFAILGLTDHLLANSFSDGAANTAYTVTLNGDVFATGTLGRGEPAVSLLIPQEQFQFGENSLVITKDGGGQLYYVINTTVYEAQAEVEAAGQIEITRKYIDPETNQAITTFEAGQLVKVQLEVRLAQDGSYMIIEDSLPGGLEALNERLNTTTFAADIDWNGETYYWQQYGYNHKEVFGDRVSFFVTEMDDGLHTITYMARATRPGTFTAMPVEAYAMYNLALWGRSASHMITVTEFNE